MFGRFGRQIPLFLLFTVLAIPRIVRLLSPNVWVESEAYLNCSFLVSLGMKPFIDFPLCHPPGPEILLGSLFLLTGACIRSVEILTQLLVFFCSIMIFFIGKRLANRVVAISAAILYSVSYVIFRYHVFEREIYIAIPVLLACWFAIDLAEDRNPSGKPLLISLLLSIAFLVKLTALAHVFGILTYLMLSPYGFRKTLSILVTTAILTALIFGVLLVSYGRAFFIQVFLFQFVVHASAALAPKLRLFSEILDINLSLGFAGLLLLILNRKLKFWMLPVLELSSTFLFIVLLNATFWPHNGIELLPWLCLLAGYFIAGIVAGIRELKLNPGLAVAVCLFVILATTVFPFKVGDWGFGYQKRSDIESLSKVVKIHSRPEDVIQVPSIIAFESNRKEAVPFEEIAGTMIDLQDEVQRKGWMATIRNPNLDKQNFGANVEQSRRFWIPKLFLALQENRIPVVMNSPTRGIGPFVPIHIKEPFLRQLGYTPLSLPGNYVLWFLSAESK